MILSIISLAVSCCSLVVSICLLYDVNKLSDTLRKSVDNVKEELARQGG